MALDGKKLGVAIWEKLSPGSKKDEVTRKYWEAVGEAICDYFKENAEVPSGIEVSTTGGNGSTTGVGKVQ